ncbi:hypothetical protein [Paenibacillus sp.]|uniref:hypothetical protein n=1 Tax=Paenibacillus sp. TaxID=58172 RepID=UPI002D3B32EC|nr:hypothetical protein [Paenibacillus sp.]HZG56437.1 hypothetical protein [Paenibacillus sp.]
MRIQKTIAGFLAAALALAPFAAAHASTRGEAAEAEEERSFFSAMTLSENAEVIYPAGSVVTTASDVLVVFTAPSGEKVQIAEGDEVLWEGFGLGGVRVAAQLHGLTAGEVHLLTLRLPDLGESVTLPPIVVKSYVSFDIRDVAKIAMGIGGTTGWDFNQDGLSNTPAEKAADMAAVLRKLEPTGQAAPTANDLDELLWSDETGSGLWNVYYAATDLKNEAVGRYVQLPAGDGSEGKLPVSPFGDTSLWYGSATVTNSVYGQGNYMNQVSGSPWLNGGMSISSHQGSIVSPVVSVPASAHASLSFWSWWEIESDAPDSFDVMTVRVYNDDYVEEFVLNPEEYDHTLPDYKPYTSGGADAPAKWVRYEFPLGTFAGADVRIELDFSTGDAQYNGFRGWFVDELFVGANTEPVGTEASIGGTAAVGGVLTASLSAADADGDALGAPKFAWYATDPQGNKKRIGGGAALTVLPEHEGSFITVEAYPYDGKEYGHPASATVWIESDELAVWPADGVVTEDEGILLFAPSGNDIFYTIDGSDPSDPVNVARHTFAAPIFLEEPSVVKAVYGAGEEYSDVHEFEFELLSTPETDFEGTELPLYNYIYGGLDYAPNGTNVYVVVEGDGIFEKQLVYLDGGLNFVWYATDTTWAGKTVNLHFYAEYKGKQTPYKSIEGITFTYTPV